MGKGSQPAGSTAWKPGSVPDAAMAVVKRLEGFAAEPCDDNGELPG